MTAFIRLISIILFLSMQLCYAEIVSNDEDQEEIDTQMYVVEALSPTDDPDEFVIDDKHYDPKTYCDVAVGDRIVFLVNTPYDCVEAKLYNYRTKHTCDVWCTT